MKQRKAILIITAAVCLASVIIIAIQFQRASASHAPMPVYQGRTAREWLDQVFTTNQPAAMTAFQAMGTNSFPVLVRALNDSQWDRYYGSMYSNVPVAIRKHMSAPVSPMTWSAAELMLLNNNDSYMVCPDLARLMRDKRNRARRYIIGILRAPLWQQRDRFVPIFIECLTDADPLIRSEAAGVLGAIGSGAKSASVPLTAALNDPSSEVRIQAAYALWNIEGGKGRSFASAKQTLETEALQNNGFAVVFLSYVDPEYPDIIPMLRSVLKNDRQSQPSALFALQKLGPAAKEAVPAILDLLNQRSGPITPQIVLQTLEKIDPEAAHKYKQVHPDP